MLYQFIVDFFSEPFLKLLYRTDAILGVLFDDNLNHGAFFLTPKLIDEP